MTTVNPGFDDLQSLRRCLAPQYAMLPSPQLAALLEQRFGNGAAQAYDEYLEGFFDDVGAFVRRVAPVVANVAGGVVQGIATGSSAGPIGMIAGGIAGGAGRALSSYGKGPLRDIGNVLNTGVNIASQFTPQGRMGSQIGSMVSGLPQTLRSPQALLQQAPALLGAISPQAGSAAQRLSSFTQRPEVRQALGALQLGDLGRNAVSVGTGQTQIPVAAITSLLQHLSAQALDEAVQYADGSEAPLAYMIDAQGRPLGDPTLETDRHAQLLALLDQAQYERQQAQWQALLQAQQQQLAQLTQGLQAPRGAGGVRSASPRRLLSPPSWGAMEAYEEDFGEDLGEDFGEALDEAGEALAEAWEEGNEEAFDETFEEGSDEAWGDAGTPWIARHGLEFDHVNA